MRTHRLPSNGVQTSLPLPTHTYVPKPFYGLFKKTADEKWHKVSENIYADEKVAIQVFLSRLTEAPLTTAIRIVKVSSDKVGHFRGVTYNEFKDSPLRERVSKR